MSDASHLRASDEDRERFAQNLREHFAAGRIAEDELAERLDAIYAARTIAELEAVVHDLPALPLSPAARRAELAERRSELRRHLLQQAGGSLTPFVICTVVWAASGAQSNFWPAFLLIFPVLFLVRNGWRLYGPAPDLDRVQLELGRGSGRSGRGRRRNHRGPHRGQLR
jgi:phospholipid N-methyltransferase